ncbi:hypothetical protein TVAG_483880 [Trichomonas vaginalis G3]|uniref:Uncharacterized protein n=1 Tax=Trichomonas vaginalis (strain ATCC PRA-98 / G3) TaxID=412133 RepID=A2EA31_TRIV3|nr:hypothetical protein TVAGG3_0980970 [Trichomonas vaginalis G3]EAY10477.1 hypothetical protein TVAG_483880 [Trichomonas vaginalis G3]KAI5489295.1 hypothetical protein TVAGG3_0980970 [Trichomonas vaginalis G3]|eukprot:XP_001322700.1 hypothetical protein [Trichomonas vaginalis G3]
MSFFGFGKKDKKLAELKEIFKQLAKAEKSQYEDYFQKMMPYIPEYTCTILNECLSKMNQVLATGYSNVVIEMIYVMSNNVDRSKPEQNPFKIFQTDNFILPSLFQYVDKDKTQLIKLLKILFLELTNKFIDYIDGNGESVMRLVKLVTESQDKLSIEFLLMCVNSKEELKEKYQTIIFNELPLWTPTCVINVLVGYPQMFSHILTDEIDRWLKKKYQFLVDDVEQLLKIHQFLWTSPSILQILVRTTPEIKAASVNFIHRQNIQSFDIPNDIVEECCESILNPLQKFEVTSEGDSKVTYYFIRFYVLSLSGPDDVPLEIIDLIAKSLTDKSDYLVAAAAQVITCWVLNFEYNLSRKFFYLMTAAAVNRDLENPCRLLLQGILSIFAEKDEFISRILMAEPNFQSRVDKPLKVVRESFVFPHFVPIFKSQIEKEKKEPYFVNLDLATTMLEDAVSMLEL